MKDQERVTFNVNTDLKKRIQCIPWGNQGAIMRNLMTACVVAIEENGSIMLGALLSGEFKLVYEPKEKEDETG